MFEKVRQPLLPARAFFRRMLGHFGLATTMVAFALGIGVLGYRFIEGMPWMDALLNASMILGGMGPVGELTSNSGKVFASLYALFSAFVFLTAAAVMFSPLVHRLLHHFHIEIEEKEKKDDSELIK